MYNRRQLIIKLLCLKIKLIVGANILKLNFLPLYLVKLIFFKKQRFLSIFSSICVWNISSFRHILVPKCEIYLAKITNLGYFRPKPYLKTAKAQFILDQNYCWVKIVKGEMRVEIWDAGRPWWPWWKKYIYGYKTAKMSFKNIKNINI